MKVVKSMSRVSPKREYRHPSLDEKMKKRDKLHRNEKVNHSIELLGKKFRGIVEVLDPDQNNYPRPTNNREVNRRAGKTAIAVIVAIGTLIGGAFYWESISDQEITDIEASSPVADLPLTTETSSKLYSDSFINDISAIEI